MNIDRLQRFPNQNIEKRPTECTAETVCDILGNIHGVAFDPGFTYAATLKLEGVEPTTAGADTLASMLSAVVYGVLPVDKEPFDAMTMGELYEANFNNYPPEDKRYALKYAERGVKPLHDYQDIVSYLNRYQTGVPLTIDWYDSFNVPGQDGLLPPPVGRSRRHDVAVYACPLKGLMIKPWLGPDYGDHGYGYLSQVVFNLVAKEAYGFDPDAWRWLQLARIALNYPSTIRDVLPQLKTS